LYLPDGEFGVATANGRKKPGYSSNLLCGAVATREDTRWADMDNTGDIAAFPYFWECSLKMNEAFSENEHNGFGRTSLWVSTKIEFQVAFICLIFGFVLRCFLWLQHA